jgi:hypothetical protein
VYGKKIKELFKGSSKLAVVEMRKKCKLSIRFSLQNNFAIL